MEVRCNGLVDRRGRDVHRNRRRRPNADVSAIVLHQTGVNVSFIDDRPAADIAASENTETAVRVDRVKAHFVVLQNGVIYYTHDIEDYMTGSAGGRNGVDIEFAGRFLFGRTPVPENRVPREMLIAGRKLVEAICTSMPSITHIHPHGQVQRLEAGPRDPETGERATVSCGGAGSPNPCGKLYSCPGADLWMNVGEWAASSHADGGLNLICDMPRGGMGFPSRGINDLQRIEAFRLDDL